MTDHDREMFEQYLMKKFGVDGLKRNESLKAHTTWRIGGPAEYYVEATKTDELIFAVKCAYHFKMPVFILGGGSNVLISDKGIKGLVVKNLIREFEIVGDRHGSEIQQTNYTLFVKNWQEHAYAARHTAVDYHFYDNSDNPSFNSDSVYVRASSGYVMSAFIEEAFKNGLTGLEQFARIPGTLGGWIFNNVHAHTTFVGSYIYDVSYLDPRGMLHRKTWEQLDFAYNYSRFHNSKDVILGATLRLFRGDVEKAREMYKSVLQKKLDRQPGNSIGSVFGNLSPEDAARNKFESESVGYVIDKVLGWNGQKRVGGAWISEKNGNFIETDEKATESDVEELIGIIKDEFKKKFDIELKEEFFRVGE